MDSLNKIKSSVNLIDSAVNQAKKNLEDYIEQLEKDEKLLSFKSYRNYKKPDLEPLQESIFYTKEFLDKYKQKMDELIVKLKEDENYNWETYNYNIKIANKICEFLAGCGINMSAKAVDSKKYQETIRQVIMNQVPSQVFMYYSSSHYENAYKKAVNKLEASEREKAIKAYNDNLEEKKQILLALFNKYVVPEEIKTSVAINECKELQSRLSHFVESMTESDLVLFNKLDFNSRY